MAMNWLKTARQVAIVCLSQTNRAAPVRAQAVDGAPAQDELIGDADAHGGGRRFHAPGGVLVLPGGSRVPRGMVVGQGAKKAVGEQGLLGAFTGGITATAGGVAAAILFGYLFALLVRPKTKM